MTPSIARRLRKASPGRGRRRQEGATVSGDNETTPTVTLRGLERLLWRHGFRPRRGAAARETLVGLGVTGGLARLVNDGSLPEEPRQPSALRALPSGIRALRRAGARWAASERTGWPAGYGRRLVEMFLDRGWRGVQLVLLWDPPRFHNENEQRAAGYVRLALTECLLFEQARFTLARCDHGNHWFGSDDRRRRECLLHRFAGQQVRQREGRRARAVLEALGRHGMTREELRQQVRVREGGRRRTMRRGTLEATLQALAERGEVTIRRPGDGQERFYRKTPGR